MGNLDILEGVNYDNSQDAQAQPTQKKIRVLEEDGKITEYKSRSEAAVKTKAQIGEEVSQTLFRKSKTKSLTDLIYEEEASTDDMSESELNKVDTTNPRYNRNPNLPSCLIKKKAAESFGPALLSVKEGVDVSELAQEKINQKDPKASQGIDVETEILMYIFKHLIKPRFVTGQNKITGVDEMLPSDSDEEQMAENNHYRKSRLGAEAEISDEDDEEKFLKPHMKNQPTKEEIIQMKKISEFTNSDFG
jgi:hypothetical protein